MRRIEMNKINRTIAKKATLIFGTVWVCYLFMLYGFISLFPGMARFQAQLLFWSNWVQLWSLPLIIVGQNILSEESERRSVETHDAVMRELSYATEDRQAMTLVVQDMSHLMNDIDMLINEMNVIMQIEKEEHK